MFAQEEIFKDTDKPTCMRKHVPISVSISTNFVGKKQFCFGTLTLITSLQPLSELCKVVRTVVTKQKQTKLFFPDVETTKKVRFSRMLEKLNQHHSRREQVSSPDIIPVVCEKKTVSPILQGTKINNFLIYRSLWNVIAIFLAVFSSNSAKYDLNLTKPYLFFSLINQRDIEPTLINKGTSSSHSKSMNASFWIY